MMVLKVKYKYTRGTVMKNVVLIGASSKEDSYSYMAFKLLKEKGFNVIPVHPFNKEIDGIKVRRDLDGLSDIYAVTLYVNPVILKNYEEQIVAIKPQRVIFNPGTVSPDADKRFSKASITTVEACSIVLLKTDRF